MIENSKQRIHFLSKEWNRYPAARETKHAGRVVEIEKDSISLMADGQVISISHSEIKNWSDMRDILIPGDVVAVDRELECTLLVPWQSERAEKFDPLDVAKILQKIRRQYLWNHFIAGVREFFINRKFLEVQTPSLVENPGPEPTIDVFKTQFKDGRDIKDKYLLTSPELSLKKLVSQTLTPLYEITKVYRNNEKSEKHRPEFWMLEWYRPFADLKEIAKDIENLILFLRSHLKINEPPPEFHHTSFQEILRNAYDFSFTPESSVEDLRQCLTKNRIYFSESLDLDDLFTLTNLELVEPKLDPEKVVFLNRYPPYAAALAKIDYLGWAERFEVYWKGLEIGNAFNELNDPDIQLQRLNDDNQKKQKNGLEPLPIDREFIECLRQGLPPTSGISIGLERLFMALFDENDIKNLKWF